MSSNRDINSKLGDVAIALTDIVSRLQAASGTTSSELERARNAVRSLELIENRQLIEKQTTDWKTDNWSKNRQLIAKRTTDRKTDNWPQNRQLIAKQTTDRKTDNWSKNRQLIWWAIAFKIRYHDIFMISLIIKISCHHDIFTVWDIRINGYLWLQNGNSFCTERYRVW